MKGSPAKPEHGSLYPVNGWWRYSYRIPGRKVRTERLGKNEKNAAKRARFVSDVIDQVKSKVISADEAERLVANDRPIARDLELYEKHLKNKGLTDTYITGTIFRVKECIETLGATRLRHITQQAVEGKLIEKLRVRKRRRGDGSPGGPDAPPISEQTVAHFVTALKQFTRRMKKMGRIGSDPLADVDGLSIGEDVAGKRRDFTEEEIRVLLATTNVAKRKKWNAMLGPDRAMLYAFAYCTGLRKGELRPAQTSWLNLPAAPAAVAEVRAQQTGTITVPGQFTKNGKQAVQPLPSWLVDAARTWLDGRTGVLFPRMPQSLHGMFQKDREAARQAWINEKDVSAEERKRREESPLLNYKTEDGVLVFHSLRHGYVSTLANADVAPKLAQALARHADIRTTMNRYAKARRKNTSDAVERTMPDLSGSLNKKESTTETTGEPKKAAPGRKREAQRNKGNVRRFMTVNDDTRRQEATGRQAVKT